MLTSAFLFKSNNNCWFLISNNMNSTQLQHQTITSLKSQPFRMDWLSFAFLFAHQCICHLHTLIRTIILRMRCNCLPIHSTIFSVCFFFFSSQRFASNWNFLFFSEKCTCNYHANRCVRNTKLNDFIQFLRTSIIYRKQTESSREILLKAWARARLRTATLFVHPSFFHFNGTLSLSVLLRIFLVSVFNPPANWIFALNVSPSLSVKCSRCQSNQLCALAHSMLLKLVEIETVYRAIDALAQAASRLCEHSRIYI